MLDFIVYSLSFFITIPLLASFFVYIIRMIRERNKLKAFHAAVNWTTILYIIAVLIMLMIIFDRNFIGIVLIFLLLALSLIVFIQWRTGQDVQIKKAAKLLWRISFLLFFLLYGCLMIVGIIKNLTA